MELKWFVAGLWDKQNVTAKLSPVDERGQNLISAHQPAVRGRYTNLNGSANDKFLPSTQFPSPSLGNLEGIQ